MSVGPGAFADDDAVGPDTSVDTEPEDPQDMVGSPTKADNNHTREVGVAVMDSSDEEHACDYEHPGQFSSKLKSRSGTVCSAASRTRRIARSNTKLGA